MDSYQTKITISNFSRAWTMRRWGIDCQVIYPPVDTHHETLDKKNVILSVGRFTASGLSKRQLEMMTAYGELMKPAATQWEYFSIGGVSDSHVDRAYFRKVSSLTSHFRAHVLANIKRRQLKRLYETAKIFWHAAGYGDDDHPELSEHFGIATVEAMSAGCIPVVIDKGGQTEIVEHGISGFRWSTIKELKEYTELLMQDEELRARMEKAARARATLFSRDRFVSQFAELLVAQERSGYADTFDSTKLPRDSGSAPSTASTQSLASP